MSALPQSPFVANAEADREAAVAGVPINARATVRHTDCTRAGNVVHLTLTCTSVPAAGTLFAALAQAIKAGEVSIALPAAPDKVGAAP